jgi:ankyrin repeat protein
MHVAAARNDVPMLRMLVTHGASVNAHEGADAGGRTPLHVAVELNAAAAVEFLVQSGADVDAADSARGFTPLHVAGRLLRNDIAHALLAHGCDPSKRDLSGMTAVQWAERIGNKRFVDLASGSLRLRLLCEGQALSRLELRRRSATLYCCCCAGSAADAAGAAAAAGGWC